MLYEEMAARAQADLLRHEVNATLDRAWMLPRGQRESARRRVRGTARQVRLAMLLVGRRLRYRGRLKTSQ